MVVHGSDVPLGLGASTGRPVSDNGLRLTPVQSERRTCDG